MQRLSSGEIHSCKRGAPLKDTAAVRIGASLALATLAFSLKALQTRICD